MSRCFPFPPPGYVKKPRPEEDLFQEEKQREKKHKKEKKSKRKREADDKEARNKIHDKQKEKKEKKDKHRDKKNKEKIKSKDKDKDRDKSSISDEATIAQKPETSDRDDTRTIEKCSSYKSPDFSENKVASPFRDHNGWSVTDNCLVREGDGPKFVQELGRRIKGEGKATGSQTIQRTSSSDLRRYEEMQISAVTCLQSSAKGIECGRGQRVDPKIMVGRGHKKVESKGLKDGLQFNGDNTSQILTGLIDRIVEASLQPVQRVIGKTVQEKDKCKEKSDPKMGEKRKDGDKKEKKSHGKDKGRDKIKKKEKDEEKKREEMEKERTEYEKRDQDRSKELYRNEHSCKNVHVYSSQVDNKIVSAEVNVKKTKDVDSNGFRHEHVILSNKLRKHQLMNNGKILEACPSPSLLDSSRLCVPLQDTVVTKYRKLNGSVGPKSSYMPKQKSPESTTKSDNPIIALGKPLLADKVVEASRELPQAPVVVEPSTEGPLVGIVIDTSRKAPHTSQIVEPLKQHPRADRIAEPSRKTPHPDLKYLSELLSVPKMEKWYEVDDQEWLFNNKDLPLEKQKTGVSVDSRQPHVWSETLHIESADLYALPYVIPY